MTDSAETRWLTEEEDRVWRSLWSVMTWLPVRLDAQLRTDADISLAEYHALSQISEAPGGEIRLSELAEIANMTLSHLSRVMSRMVRAGWVERVPDPNDGRSTLGRLTDAGRAKVREVAPGHVEEVRSAVFHRLTAGQVRALGSAVERIAEVTAPSPSTRPSRRASSPEP